MSLQKKPSVIVSGVTGQDGSLMADHLLKNTSYEVYGLVRRTSVPDFKNLKSALKNDRFHIVSGDVTDFSSILNLVKTIKPDYFINFAGQSHVHESWECPISTFEINANGVLNILESIRQEKPDCRVYQAGSSEEWGNVEYSPQNMNHPLKPRSPYAASKCAASHLVKVYRESYGLYAVQGILFNHESPRRGENFVTRKITKNVARIFHALDKQDNLENAKVEPLCLGNLYSKRDWSHAKDFVKGVWLMMNQKEPKDYILSSDEAHTVKEFVEKAFNAAGIYGKWEGSGLEEKFVLESTLYSPSVSKKIILAKIDKKFYRPAEVDLLLGDSTPAREELNWRPEYSFKTLLQEMVESDIKNYE